MYKVRRERIRIGEIVCPRALPAFFNVIFVMSEARKTKANTKTKDEIPGRGPE